ncbi:MAG: ABC transporter ATP-binding protein [Sphaerochaetaceae bacterium]
MNELNIKLNKNFPEFKLDIEFSAEEGQLISIIGPSGCGKSTTLSLITGLLPLDDGFIKIGDDDLSSMPINERKIAMVFQNYSLYPHLKVKDNIAYPLKIKKINKKKRYAEASRLLHLVGLDGFEDRKIESLSGGECQRIALARALASKPRLLLLDEPLSALDAKLRGYLRDEIRRIHDETGLTMIYVTHDQEEALSISDKIIVLNDGHVEMIGDGEEIYNNPTSLFAATFMGEGNLLPQQIFETLPENRPFGNVFFRPEEAMIIEDESLPVPELLPYSLLKGLNVVKVEFRGKHYIIKARKKNCDILISSNIRPKSNVISVYIRNRSLKYFNN